MNRKHLVTLGVCGTLIGGCIITGDDDDDTAAPSTATETGGPTTSTTTQPGDTEPSDESSTGGSESGSTGDSSGSSGSSSTGAVCSAEPVPCDESGDDPGAAMALCKDTPGFVSIEYVGSPDGRGVRSGLGSAATHDAREGTMFAVLGTGFVNEIDDGAFDCSQDLGNFDPGPTLPEPIISTPVEGDTSCLQDASLIGTGDCSRTIDGQFSQGGSAHDLSAIAVHFVVPEGVNSLQFEAAFFSTEYPTFYGQEFNDMFVGWVETANWTGNVSFDMGGNPISLNAGFLDYKDAPNPVDCPPPCQAPELQGTAMVGHAATKWLTTSASVSPQEDITLVFAVFDLSDGALDTFILLDNWLWNCGGGPPVTVPG